MNILTHEVRVEPSDMTALIGLRLEFISKIFASHLRGTSFNSESHRKKGRRKEKREKDSLMDKRQTEKEESIFSNNHFVVL